MVRKRIRLAQNFFRDPKLVASIIAGCSIDKSDLVYEIGPGEGVITKELAAVAGRVVAVEKDPELVNTLKKIFSHVRNVEIREADFLEYRIPASEYKIFSNIPFNITADVMRKIVHAENAPEEAYLVLQEEAAEKFSGTPEESQFSVLVKPWFILEIVREFERSDFEPIPGVDVVLLHVKKRETPLVSAEEADAYRRFIRFGFGTWRKNLKQVFKNVFTYTQWKRLAGDLGFRRKPIPTQLTFEQWLGIFRFFQEGIPEYKKEVILK